MLTIRQDIVDSIIAHSKSEHPNMACGLVVGPCGSDRPERLIRMENAARSPSYWTFDPAEQFRVWRTMEERDEEPVVIYYSQSNPGASPSEVTVAFASDPLAHYVIVSTFRPDNAEFRSFRIADGQTTEEEISVVGSHNPAPGTGERAEQDMGPDERARQFELAREYSTRQQTWDKAARLWVEVIDAYRRAVHADTASSGDKQQLARALWRYAMLLSMRSRPVDALAAGHEAVTIFGQVSTEVAAQDPDVTGPARDQALGDLITALADLGEICVVAGENGQRIELLEQALATGLVAAGPPLGAGPQTRQAMGTAYHNHATALLTRFVQQMDAEDLRQAVLAGSRATELRQKLFDPRRPISAWELVNTYVVYAKCLALTRDFDRVDALLRIANQAAEALGPAGAQFSAELRGIAKTVARERASSGGKATRRRWRR